MCPVSLLGGYALMIGVGEHPSGHLPAPMVEAQVCQEGLGVYATATSHWPTTSF